MTKVTIIGAGNITPAVVAAIEERFGDDVYIIQKQEVEQYKFQSEPIPFKARPISSVKVELIAPIKDGKARRRERRAKQRKSHTRRKA
ncbi:MAG TPA: hypothetical protein PKW50_04320 [Syntrophomonas sp.]|nr:hypothetical protein [Syntrophomonas sp.]